MCGSFTLLGVHVIAEFVGMKVTVVGAARTGIASAKALKRLGARVTLCDSRSEAEFDSNVLKEVIANKIRFIPEATLAQMLPKGLSLIVTSPGVPRR